MPSLINSGVGRLNVDFDELQGDSLNAHATPLVDTDLISGRTVIYNSVTPAEDLEDVAFSIPPDPECGFILNQTRLEGHFVVVTDDGEGVTPTDRVLITNHFCAALFSQIEVHLNGSQICDLSAPLSYGRPLMPRPLECSMGGDDFMELYEYFQSNISGKKRIIPEAYANGQTFLDLTPDKCLSFHNYAGVAGNLELDLTFGQVTEAPITLISCAIYNAAISIDNNLQVSKVNY